MKELLQKPDTGPFAEAARKYAIAVIGKISGRA